MFPETTTSSIFTLCYWDKVGIKVYNLTTLPGHEQELQMLPAWRAVMDTIKKQEGSKVACEATSEGAVTTVMYRDLPRSFAYTDTICNIHGTMEKKTGKFNQAVVALTIDHLAGEGLHTAANAQDALPRQDLEGIMEHLLKSLPPEPEPTLLQMIEACNCLGTLQHTTAVTYQVAGQGIPDAFAVLKLVPGKQLVCFGCGEPGHVKRDCKKA
ncbi:hypothetical protein Nmel_008509 [Mimus melanotis]